MDPPTAQDIFDQFDLVESIVTNYGTLLKSIKPPSVEYEEERIGLRKEFAKAAALFKDAKTELQELSQQETMLELGGKITDLDRNFKENCVTWNKNWEASLRVAMDQFRHQLALVLSLPTPSTGIGAGTQTEEREHDSYTGIQREQSENDIEIVEVTAAGNASTEPQPERIQIEQSENDIEIVEVTSTDPQPNVIQTEHRDHDSDTIGETPARNESDDLRPDQHETTMDESVEGNPPDNPVPEPEPLAEIELEQGPTFDDEEDDMEGNGADHDTNYTAEDAAVNHGDTTNSEANLDETMNDAPAENDDEASSSGISSDSDDEPIVPTSTRRVSSRIAGNSIESLETPVRQTRSSMARISSSRATGSSKRKEPPRNKRRASNASPPPTRSKRLRGRAETAKQINENPRQALPAPGQPSKPTETPAGGPSSNTTTELSQKGGNKSADPSTRVSRRRSQRHAVQSGEDREFQGVLKPVPGKVYATYWEGTKSFLAVVVLPMGDFCSVGFEGSIDSCDLPKNPCWTKNRKKKYTWAKGYRDGEALEKERMFPVLYFDGGYFPSKSAIMWCAGRDLREFRDEHQLVPYMKTVRQYLQSRGLIEDTQDSEAGRARTKSAVREGPETEAAGTESVAHEEPEAERARSESVGGEIQVAGSDDDFAESSDTDSDSEDLDATVDAEEEEDLDMADVLTEEPSNTRRRSQQNRPDQREEDRPADESPEPERPSEPAAIPATASPFDEPLTEASALDEPLVDKQVNFDLINEHVRDTPRKEQRETRPPTKAENFVVILSDSEGENENDIPVSKTEEHSTAPRPLSHIFPFETPDRASYPPIGTFRHTSTAASQAQSASPSQSRQEPSHEPPQRTRSSVHQLLNDPSPSHRGRSESASSAQAQQQLSIYQPDPPVRAEPSRRDTSRFRIHDILSPEPSSEPSGSAQLAQRERSPSTLQETAVQAVNAMFPGSGTRQKKACEKCSKLKRRCDPSHLSGLTQTMTMASLSPRPAAHSRSSSAQHHPTPSASPSVNLTDDLHASQSPLFKFFGKQTLQCEQTPQSTQTESQVPSPSFQLQRRSASAAISQRGSSIAQNDRGRSDEDWARPDRPPAETFDEFIYDERGDLPPDHSCFHVVNVLEKPRYFSPMSRSSRCPPGLTRYLAELLQAAGDTLRPGLGIEENFQLVDDKGYSGGYWCPFCKACNCHRFETYQERANYVAHLLTHWRKAGGS
ncbi:hypothetical protein NW752_001477 [Fusarium irregulare]|nr:hypothetical protein NW752_001477 [Fusarium irregulare]